MSSLDGDSRAGLHILSQDAQDSYIAPRKPWDSNIQEIKANTFFGFNDSSINMFASWQVRGNHNANNPSQN